jgi:hypothetical protein
MGGIPVRSSEQSFKKVILQKRGPWANAEVPKWHRLGLERAAFEHVYS